MAPKQPMFGKNGWLSAGKRSCRRIDGSNLRGTAKFYCSNCRKTFVNKSKWWNHLWSIF